MGRKKIEIDWSIVDKKLSHFCEGTEIAEYLGISPMTLYRATERVHKVNFDVYKAQKRAKGEMNLREMQLQSAAAGNIAMQIWLGKQYLNQTDKADHTSKGESIKPDINISVVNKKIAEDLKKLFDADN